MLELKRQTAKLTNVNLRAERHGDETALACDLNFKIKAGNDALSAFDPQLKAAFYCRHENPPQGDLVEGGANWLPNLRFPEITQAKWKKELAGFTLTVHHGINADSDIVLEDCVVKDFGFEFSEGGSCTISFQVQCHPESEDLGDLGEKIQSETEITLQPPAAPEMKEEPQQPAEAALA